MEIVFCRISWFLIIFYDIRKFPVFWLVNTAGIWLDIEVIVSHWHHKAGGVSVILIRSSCKILPWNENCNFTILHKTTWLSCFGWFLYTLRSDNDIGGSKAAPQTGPLVIILFMQFSVKILLTISFFYPILGGWRPHPIWEILDPPLNGEPVSGKTRVGSPESPVKFFRYILIFSFSLIYRNNFIEIREMALNSNQGNRSNRFIDSYNNSDVGDFLIIVINTHESCESNHSDLRSRVWICCWFTWWMLKLERRRYAGSKIETLFTYFNSFCSWTMFENM